jgi:hypothetical protein
MVGGYGIESLVGKRGMGDFRKREGEIFISRRVAVKF